MKIPTSESFFVTTRNYFTRVCTTDRFETRAISVLPYRWERCFWTEMRLNRTRKRGMSGFSRHQRIRPCRTAAIHACRRPCLKSIGININGLTVVSRVQSFQTDRSAGNFAAVGHTCDGRTRLTGRRRKFMR